MNHQKQFQAIHKDICAVTLIFGQRGQQIICNIEHVLQPDLSLYIVSFQKFVVNGKHPLWLVIKYKHHKINKPITTYSPMDVLLMATFQL